VNAELLDIFKGNSGSELRANQKAKKKKKKSDEKHRDSTRKAILAHRGQTGPVRDFIRSHDLVIPQKLRII
jgi:hypothetical protein